MKDNSYLFMTLLAVSAMSTAMGVFAENERLTTAYCNRNMHWQPDDPIYKEFGVYICKYCDVRVEIGE